MTKYTILTMNDYDKIINNYELYDTIEEVKSKSKVNDDYSDFIIALEINE